MKWQFKEDVTQNELSVTISKQAYDQEVAALVSYLDDFSHGTATMIPIKTADRIVMLAVADVVLVEVSGDDLLIKTEHQTLVFRERLYRFKEKLPTTDFVQVSRQTIININHLKSLEASFSGNLLAHLTGGLKTSVSRRYVKDLERILGI
ncbi:LytTR family DNA-binding domain-containing protein [Streptococcus sp. sy004]|uniref:LytTR family DNA-binding domain-containing protein n=1 Tax=Streptococcus sp. sy004 TaxID=2600149 RepID=UPI0011B70C24|nr:LytTR family DNA-binding domain-containing protein [Streptococcus sp. sy004]TWT11050.1 LytTR family transcriptional regulator [Streptococcus sp. sy004]